MKKYTQGYRRFARSVEIHMTTVKFDKSLQIRRSKRRADLVSRQDRPVVLQHHAASETC